MGSSDQDRSSAAPGGDRSQSARLLAEHGLAVLEWLSDKIPRRWQAVLSAEDVLQQTCIDAFLHFDQFVPETENSFAAWLRTIAERNLLNALRGLEADKRGGKHRRVEPRTADDSFDLLCEQLASSQSTPSRHVARDEARAALSNAVQQLPEDYRRVVQMYDLDAQPVEDVARVLNRSPGAVHMIRARAHEWLGEVLGSATRYFSTG